MEHNPLTYDIHREPGAHSYFLFETLGLEEDQLREDAVLQVNVRANMMDALLDLEAGVANYDDVDVALGVCVAARDRPEEHHRVDVLTHLGEELLLEQVYDSLTG